MRKLASISVLLLLFSRCAPAQEAFRLYQYLMEEQQTITDSFADYESAAEFAGKIIPDLHLNGFITASVDSTHLTDSSLHLYIYKGVQYKWKALEIENVPEGISKSARALIQRQEGKSINPADIRNVSEYLLKYADETGYPFASIRFKDVRFHPDQSITATLFMDIGDEYRIDSVHVIYGGRLHPAYFYKYLDIGDGMRYSAKKMRSISPLIASLPFLQESRPWELQFGVNDNILNIYLQERKANQVNAIIGMQPSSDPDKRFDFTADILLAFHNEMGYGERMKFSYQQLQNASPRMNASVYWPYLFGSNFGAEGGLDYQKFDTSFRKTVGTIGVLYQFSAFDYVKVFAEIESNRVITFDTAFVSRQKRLPPHIDLTKSGGGLSINISKVNNALNPRKGIIVNASLTGSRRKIIPNSAVEQVYDPLGEHYGYLYDSLEAAQLQAKIRTSISGFIPLWKMITLRMGYENGYISSRDLFRNELYQIGGFKLLRGFNELSLFSDHFHIGTIEPRILLGPLSHLYLFSDFGYVSTLNPENRSSSFSVLSFGVGGTISTASGIFNVAFGLGKQGTESLQFSNTRVHFGYAVYF